jgi:hypothetical protein
MGLVMDLVAGESREILLAVAVDDLAAFGDRSRFAAHLSFGGSIDPTWLDLFSQAARDVTGRDHPVDFLEARGELDPRGELEDRQELGDRREPGGPANGGEPGRTVERIDPGWVTSVAMLGDDDLDAVTGRWIDLLEAEVGDFAREEKPSIRTFATEIVEFARRADSAPSVLLAWSL